VTADREGDDRRLARRIATLLRVGTAVAAVLLVAGSVLLLAHPGGAATALLIAGCAVIVVLPALRLAAMIGHVARADRFFLPIAIVVLLLVLAGAALGVRAGW
jgi:uncharacterized membrane protein